MMKEWKGHSFTNMSIKKYTTGDIRADIGMPYRSVENIRITSCEGTHGRLYLTVCADETTAPDEIQRLAGQPVHVRLADGTLIFAGTCKSAGLENRAGYKSVHMEAAGMSEKMDRGPKDRVFQDPGKTLAGIARLVAGEGKDYTAEYTNNIDSGKGTIILKATKNSDYDGYKTVQFNITGVNMSKIKVKGVSAKEFNGTGGIEQNLDDIILTYTYKNKETKEKETTTLILGKDYDVTYKNNDKAGTAKIVFTGRGLYNGVLNKSFKINKVKLTNNMLDSSNIVAYMDKKGAKLDVKLSYNGIQLVKGKDYKLSYSNNKKATTDERKAKIIITGKGSYKGTLYTTFDILPKSISDETIAIKTTEVQFDPDSKTNTYTTKAKVYDNGVALKVNKDYIVKPSENKITSLPAQGYTTGTVIIEGLGDYCGTRMAEFKIVTRLLSDSAIKVKIKGKYYYFGLPVTLEQKDIIVTDSKNKNKQLDASEYKITGYQNNNSAGTASVTIKGLGKYGGSRTITYTINYANTEKTKEVINLVNKERTARGLSELKMNQKLMYAAMIRAEEISESFSHTRPDGTSCFTIFEDLNIDYYGAGENIAYGYVSPEAVMTGWMNSPGHKANILTGSFTEIGVGCFEKNGRLYWVQMFITAP